MSDDLVMFIHNIIALKISLSLLSLNLFIFTYFNCNILLIISLYDNFCLSPLTFFVLQVSWYHYSLAFSLFFFSIIFDSRMQNQVYLSFDYFFF